MHFRPRLMPFVADARGSVMFAFALVTPVLLAGMGAAIDYARTSAQRADLQAAADAAALASSRELALSGSGNGSYVQEVADTAARTQLGEKARAGLTVTATLVAEGTGVTVSVAEPTDLFFAGFLAVSPDSLVVTATAQTMGEKICVIALGDSKSSAVRLRKSAQVVANGCSVYSNSDHKSSIDAGGSSRLTAQSICTVGGYEGTSANFDPQPFTDCPAMPDPLAERAPPGVDSCLHTDLLLDGVTTTLQPGTYCGGLEIKGAADVTLQPGTYVIKNGPLLIDGTTNLRGEYVGFYFTGKGASLRFTKHSAVELSAPKQGTMAGLLFWQDPAASTVETFKITSDYTRTLLGTIYLPQGRFVVDADRPVADRSAYTAIVALGIDLDAGPELVINSNYSQTDVPVPTGLGPTGATRLVN